MPFLSFFFREIERLFSYFLLLSASKGLFRLYSREGGKRREGALSLSLSSSSFSLSSLRLPLSSHREAAATNSPEIYIFYVYIFNACQILPFSVNTLLIRAMTDSGISGFWLLHTLFSPLQEI